jgi:TolB-like protein/Flp pilus assembly protein TadD
MIAGHLPFEGETAMEMIGAILHKEPTPIDADVPAEIDKIINKCLRKDRTERYQTIKDVCNDLKDVKQDLEFQNKLERTITPEKEEAKTQILQATTVDETNQTATNQTVANNPTKRYLTAALAILLISAIGFFGYRYYQSTLPINSVAVLPFENKSSDADTDYLSDGLAESLIYRLSQIPNLKVSPTSSVFRYKGKETDAKVVANELGVDAVMTGRIVQRGDNLTISVELVDVRNNKSLWGEKYERKMSELLATQREIAAEITNKLQLKLSGEGEQKLAKKYTDNNEAYQLYLKGRYHLLKLQPSETNKAISFYQQAIAIDPNYALAYVGLASAYRSLAVAGEMPATEFFPKAKAAATKAIEIDDTLAEAYAALGYVIFRYDWNWNEAENKCERALELDPNSAEAHETYAHLLSSTARHAEALAEIKRARELDPLNLRIGVVEAQFLIYAGQADEALFRSQKIFELDPEFSFAHSFASSAYIEKGMYPEAIAEARKGRVLSGGRSHAIAFEGYALAKTGKQAEARAVLDELLKLSTERYVPPYPVALVYNGLGERDKTFEWLEKGYQHRDARMMFLKVEPKWNNLRDDPRFQELLRKLGFPQ